MEAPLTPAQRTQDNFMKELPNVIDCISKAHLVTVDFEFSGIERNYDDRKGVQHRPSLEEYYGRIAGAARTFTILQVGITCVFQDPQEGSYASRTWNFNLNPGVNQTLRLSRVFQAQSNVIQFLNGNQFDWNAALQEGVRYLSKAEQHQLLERINDDTKQEFSDTKVNMGDHQGQNMVNAARRRISEWLTPQGQATQSHVTLPTKNEDGQRIRPNPYHRGLLYTLVRREFADLRIEKQGDFLAVRKNTPESIAYQKRQGAFRRSRETDAVQTNRGLGWIFEALSANSDLSNLTDDVLGAHGEDLNKRRKLLDSAIETLRVQGPPPVFVHNGFSDLIYLYATFYAEPPAALADFCVAIHKLFPSIYDTKYMFTAKNPINGRHNSNLNEVSTSVTNWASHTKLLELKEHWSQLNTGKEHSAGHDSYLTAICAVNVPIYLAHRAIKNGESPDDVASYKEAEEQKIPVTTPRFEHMFWMQYVNRLCVFGSEEGVMGLKCSKGVGACAQHSRWPAEGGPIYPQMLKFSEPTNRSRRPNKATQNTTPMGQQMTVPMRGNSFSVLLNQSLLD